LDEETSLEVLAHERAHCAGWSHEETLGHRVSEPGAAEATTPEDDQAEFVSVVLADTEDTWGRILGRMGETYREPILVLYTGQVVSGCGPVSTATGPLYCSSDEKMYFDLSFFGTGDDVTGATDMALAYGVAQNVGRHVQNLLGILSKVEGFRQRATPAVSDQLSLLLELQAECLAGVWAHDANARDVLEVRDIEGMQKAAAQFGNDGSGEQVNWFRRGYEQGVLDDCNTFAAHVEDARAAADRAIVAAHVAENIAGEAASDAAEARAAALSVARRREEAAEALAAATTALDTASAALTRAQTDEEFAAAAITAAEAKVAEAEAARAAALEAADSARLALDTALAADAAVNDDTAVEADPVPLLDGPAPAIDVVPVAPLRLRPPRTSADATAPAGDLSLPADDRSLTIVQP